MTLHLSKAAPDPAAVIRQAAFPLTTDHDHQRILAEIGDASLVLIGEATHGTQDFHATRVRITRALIEERGFSGVAIEGDWPDAYRVNRYVQRTDGGVDAADALGHFGGTSGVEPLEHVAAWEPSEAPRHFHQECEAHERG